MQFQKLQRTIDYEFKNHDLLVEALTHPSIAHERGTESNHHNQRLEFLGDAVLQLVLTDRIYKLYPEHPEGKLTQIRAHLANRHTLFHRAQAIELGKHLMLGKGEEGSGGRERLSNLADAYESLLGAVYLDGGIRAARKFILTQFAEEFSNIKQTTPPAVRSTGSSTNQDRTTVNTSKRLSNGKDARSGAARVPAKNRRKRSPP